MEFGVRVTEVTGFKSWSAQVLTREHFRRKNMVFAGIKVPDTTLVRDAIDLSRSLLEPYLFNHVMRSWLFGILLSEGAELPRILSFWL